ncbi:MAG: integron integrase [Longimicrobiales bacterium]
MARHPLTERALAATRRVLRTRGYQPRTEGTYLGWVRRFLVHHRHPHPRELDAGHVERFLSHLANTRRCSASTRNQAASALAFFYREVLRSDAVVSVPRARGRGRLPTVLSHGEAQAVLGELRGRAWLVASLLYGTGMRLSEALGLRVKDLDFELARITVREGKGGRDRVVMLPQTLAQPLRRQLDVVKEQHRADRRRGRGWAPLPHALHAKSPDAGWDPAWQFLFPGRAEHPDPATDRRGRTPLHPSAIQRAVKRAVRRAGIHKPATCHTFRHSFATQLLRDGYDIRVVQELLGHSDVRTTMIYLHVADQMGLSVRSPLDREGAGRPDASGPRRL